MAEAASATLGWLFSQWIPIHLTYKDRGETNVQRYHKSSKSILWPSKQIRFNPRIQTLAAEPTFGAAQRETSQRAPNFKGYQIFHCQPTLTPQIHLFKAFHVFLRKKIPTKIGRTMFVFNCAPSCGCRPGVSVCLCLASRQMF